MRCPCPLFERYSDPRESTWKSWRFWGSTTRGSRAGWWFLHPIVVSERQHTVNRYTFHRRFWPFYVEEETHGYDARGNSHLESSHFRIWPLFSSDYTEEEGLRRRSLILFPIRDVPAIERNWSPFWTFYTATQKPGEKEVLHELFWGLIWWHTEADPLESEAPPPPPDPEKPIPLLAPLAQESFPQKHQGTQGPGHKGWLTPPRRTENRERRTETPLRGDGQSLVQASKPLNFQASLDRPACGSTPLICLKSAKSAVPNALGFDRGVHTQVGGFDDSLA